jgi:NADPH:quinone reductase-like Zn-dependent oxidoreductase
MAMPQTMNALLVRGDGYTREPSQVMLEAMGPYVELGTISVPQPDPSQLLIKVRLGAINPSDVAFIQGRYGQPRKQGQPAGFEGVGDVVAAGAEPTAQALLGKRVAFATGLTYWGS